MAECRLTGVLTMRRTLARTVSRLSQSADLPRLTICSCWVRLLGGSTKLRGEVASCVAVARHGRTRRAEDRAVGTLRAEVGATDEHNYADTTNDGQRCGVDQSRRTAPLAAPEIGATL